MRRVRLRDALPGIAALLLWAVAGLSAARAADFELPALNTPPSQEHHTGKMVWADLVTPDLAAAEKFYGGLFGWTFRRIRAENYELLKELPESAFDRTGNHTENGAMTLRALLEGYSQHAESHARQLQEIREQYKQRKGKK